MIVYGPSCAPNGAQRANVTSGGSSPTSDKIAVPNSTQHFAALSPFFVGPVTVYPGKRPRESKTHENGWQYTKVYRDHIDASGAPTAAHAKWLMGGLSATKAN